MGRSKDRAKRTWSLVLRRFPYVAVAIGAVTLLTLTGRSAHSQAPAEAQAPASPAVPPDGATAMTQQPPDYPERSKAPTEVLDRGKAVYGVSCAFCHGSDAAGGEVGPNLLRSGVVLKDQSGELIAPIVHGSRVSKGMPRIDITDAQITDIAAWLHSLHVNSQPTAPEVPIDIVRGDAAAGKVYFGKTCASCHSADADLKGLATRFPNPKTLQGVWLLPGGGGFQGYGATALANKNLHVPPTSVTVTLSSGEQVHGALTRIDDFYVGLRKDDGTSVGFVRDGDNPKVEVIDPIAPHRKLLRIYTDKDIHDVTAYLVTLH